MFERRQERDQRGKVMRQRIGARLRPAVLLGLVLPVDVLLSGRVAGAIVPA